jgi:hypothetical protein
MRLQRYRLPVVALRCHFYNGNAQRNSQRLEESGMADGSKRTPQEQRPQQQPTHTCALCGEQAYCQSFTWRSHWPRRRDITFRACGKQCAAAYVAKLAAARWD